MTMSPGGRWVTFRYQQGDVVWLGYGDTTPYIIAQQRATFRDVLGPLYEYLVYRREEPSAQWVSEADLVPVGTLGATGGPGNPTMQRSI